MSDLVTDAHTETIRMPTYELVRELNSNLGSTLVAFMANVRSRQLPRRWETSPEDPTHCEPRDEAKQRLILAMAAFRAIETHDSEHVARQWLIGANPRFGGETPAQRIREFDAKGIYGALESFIEGGGAGG